MPAVIYNSKGESFNVQGISGEIVKALHGVTTTTLIDIDFDGTQYKAFVKEIDKDPITSAFRHVAFYAVNDSDTIIFELPFKLEGVSPAVKNNLGVLVQPTKTIAVRGKVSDMIAEYTVDIENLEVPGDGILIKDIELPDGLEFVQEGIDDRAIATVTQLQKLVEEEDAEAEALAAEGAEEVEGEEEGAEGEEGEGEESVEGETTPKADDAPAEESK